MHSTMIGDRYRLEHEIGRGGSGAVWRGEDLLLGRPVALKRLGLSHGAEAPDTVRAEREATLSARVHHPHVVAVYDVEQVGDESWLVMELVEGRTAAEIAERGALSTRAAISVLAQIADGLSAAHAHRIVHRDVKPANILISGDVAKLADFGVARADGDLPLTKTGLVTGSPAYLAPEVATGSPASFASDVWSFGATAYYLAAGRPPYDAENPIDAVASIVNDPPPRLPTDHVLAALVETTLRHDPAERPEISEVTAALELLSELEPQSLAELLAEGDGSTDTPTSVDQAPADSTQQIPAAVAGAGTATAPAGGHRARRSAPGRRAMALAAAALAVAIAGGVAVASLGDETAPRAEASDAESSDGPTAEPTEGVSAETADPGTGTPSPEALENFALDYLDAVGNNLEAGYAMLTPSYQQASGGFDGYRGFWGRVSNIEVQSVSPDPDGMSVTYLYRYRIGGEQRAESVTLRLERANDGFLIADAEAAQA